jgi:hypothetical protein
MKRKLLLHILLSVILLSSAALADGDIYPGGPLGVKISRLPLTITAPGSYYLDGNLSYYGDIAITIASDDVTLDLMGFTISATGSSNTGIAISNHNSVEVRNGTLSGWFNGIVASGTGSGHRVINVRVENTGWGISLYGSGHLIQGCWVSAAGTPPAHVGFFIEGQGTVRGCTSNNFPVAGIEIDGPGTIMGNVVVGNGTGVYGGIFAGPASLIMGNQVANAAQGIYCAGAASIINNTVAMNPSKIGVRVDNAVTTMVDQNTVLGTGGTNWTAHNLTTWRSNY